MPKYTVRSVHYHESIMGVYPTLIEAIAVKTLHAVRYNMAVSIYDENEYLIPQKAQHDAIEALIWERRGEK